MELNIVQLLVVEDAAESFVIVIVSVSAVSATVLSCIWSSTVLAANVQVQEPNL
jgi:hypothetical protein